MLNSTKISKPPYCKYVQRTKGHYIWGIKGKYKGDRYYAQVTKSPNDHQGADTNAKAREFLLPSSSWGSHRYWHSSHREEPWVLGYIAYIEYSRAKNSKNGSLQVWLVTFWWRVRCWVLIGSRFPGWPGVLIGSISPAWSEFAGLAKGSDWFAGGGVRSGDFQRLLDFQRLFSQNLTKWSNLDFSEEEMTNFLT